MIDLNRHIRKISKHPAVIGLFPIFILLIYLTNDALLSKYKGDDAFVLISLSIIMFITVLNLFSFYYINQKNELRETFEDMYGIIESFIDMQNDTLIINEFQRKFKTRTSENVWFIKNNLKAIRFTIKEANNFENVKVVIFIPKDVEIPADLYVSSRISIEKVDFYSNFEMFIINPVSDKKQFEIYQKSSNNGISYYTKLGEKFSLHVMGNLIKSLNDKKILSNP